MSTIQAWQLVRTALAGWMSREQAALIDYLKEENRVLREQLGARRLRFTSDQRRRLAAKANRCCSAKSFNARQTGSITGRLTHDRPQS